MGLTIHYCLRAAGNEARARTLIHALHQTAQDLPFKERGPVVELSGDQCDYDRRSEDDPLRWLLIQTEESVEVTAQRRAPGGLTYQSYQKVRPLRLIGFAAWPGDGCEASDFGLCQFPAVVATPNGPLRTRLHHWHWGSFCKT